MTVYARDYVHGLSWGTDGVRLFLDRPLDHLDGLYRIKRYDSPSDSGTKVVKKPTALSEIDDNGLVSGRVYRYKMQLMVPAEGGSGNTKQGKPTNLYIKAGFVDPPQVTGIAAFTNTGRPINLQWNATTVDKSQFGLYEVLRRDAKQYDSQYEVIGTTVGLTLADNTRDIKKYYNYAVRSVRWDLVRGSRFDEHTAPTIPAAKCTDSNGSEQTVNLVIPRPYLGRPDDRWAAIQVWAFKESEVDGTRTRTECTNWDASDWYVLRSDWYTYTISPDCPDPAVICGRPKPEMFEYRGGGFRGGALEGMARYEDVETVWYDLPNSTDGLYRYSYQVCSYATPSVCGETLGHWRFEGTTERVPLDGDPPTASP